MKIAVASTGNNLESAVSPIFGRTSAFIIVDLINGAIKNLSAIENPAKNETGSGNTAAQFIVDHEIEILISGKLVQLRSIS